MGLPCLVNRPGVAGTVLHTALTQINLPSIRLSRGLALRSIGSVSFIQVMVGLGVPDASQTRTACRPFSTTFIAGCRMICGKPSGSDFSFGRIKFVKTLHSVKKWAIRAVFWVLLLFNVVFCNYRSKKAVTFECVQKSKQIKLQ